MSFVRRSLVASLLLAAMAKRVDVEEEGSDIGPKKVFKKVVDGVMKADAHKVEGCGQPHSGTLIVGCEKAIGLAMSRNGNAVCQAKLVEDVMGWRSEPAMESSVLETKMIARNANPQWMDAMTLDVQCLDASNLPNYWVQVEVVEQREKNSTIGMVRFPFAEVLSGDMAGRYPVMLRGREDDADFWSHVNDSRRFDWSLAEQDDAEDAVEEEEVQEDPEYEQVLETTTTTTLKLRRMKKLGQLVVNLAFCPEKKGKCIDQAVVATQGEGETSPYSEGRFDCEQSCVQHVTAKLDEMIQELQDTFEKVQKEGNYCHKEEDHGGRCGKVGNVWVSCGSKRCCSKSGWCGLSSTHCPGQDEYSSGRCKWNPQRSKSWQDGAELIRTLQARMVAEARGTCGNLLVPAINALSKPAQDTTDIINNPEDFKELYQRLATMKDAVQVMAEASHERWWSKGELMPAREAVTASCWKAGWSRYE